MALRKGLPAKLANTDADDTRYDFRNLVVCNADGTPRAGVTSPVGVNLLSSTATMNVAVAAFNAVAARDSGAILLSNDGPVNVPLANAPSSNSRIDVIYGKQNDASSTVTSPDANNTATIGAVTGTASATPVKPSIPTGAVEIGTVLVPSGATATNSSGVVITTTCPYTAAPGGRVPFRTLTDMHAWTTAGTGQGAVVFSDAAGANNDEYRWNGTSWVGSGLANTSYALTYQTIYSAGSPAPTLTVRHGRAWLDGQIISSNASFGAGGAGFTAATFDPDIAPGKTRIFGVTANGILAFVNITSSGQIIFTVSAGFTGALSLNLGDISWAVS